MRNKREKLLLTVALLAVAILAGDGSLVSTTDALDKFSRLTLKDPLRGQNAMLAEVLGLSNRQLNILMAKEKGDVEAI